MMYTQKTWRYNPNLLIFLVFVSFLTTLGVRHIGEEPVYTMSTLEMVLNKSWSFPVLLGGEYNRPALFNWLIIVVTKLFTGISGVLQAARIVTILATMASAFYIYRTCYLFTNNRDLGYLSSLIYLSGDVLLKRGWLAYADPVFASLILMSLYYLLSWFRVGKKINLIYSSTLIFLAFLAKTYTAYLFYLAVIPPLLLSKKYREKIFSSYFIFINIFLVLGPILIWQLASPDSNTSSAGFIYNVSQSLLSASFGGYLFKVISFPIWVILLSLPISVIALGSVYKNKKIRNSLFNNEFFVISLSLFIFSILPYWLAPSSDIKARYILPAMPWLSVCLAYLILSSKKENIFKISVQLIMLAIVAKLIITPWFYYQQIKVKGDTVAAAYDILRVIDDKYNIYVDTSNSRELRLAIELDLAMLDKNKIVQTYDNKEESYFLISNKQPLEGKNNILGKYFIERDWLYLTCHGGACKS